MRSSDTTALAQLQEPLRSRLTALLVQAKDAVWIGSGLRSRAEQIELRRQNCGPTWDDIYTRPSMECDPPTARPGESLHEKGLAADLEGDMRLAKLLGAQVGLNTPVRGENWHFQVDPASVGGAMVQGFDIPGPIDEAGGAIFGKVEDAVANVLGKATDPLLSGLKRIALVGTLIAGGVGLVVLGGIRGTPLGNVTAPLGLGGGST